MAWLELHEELPDHPKVLKLTKALGLHEPDFVWPKLVRLWFWCLTNRLETGELDGLEPARIAQVSNWGGDHELWLKCLLKAGWLDPKPLRVHNWPEYAGKLHKVREGNRSRQARKRARDRGPVTRDVTRDVTPMSRIQPYRTVPTTTTPRSDPDQRRKPTRSVGARAREAVDGVEELKTEKRKDTAYANLQQVIRDYQTLWSARYDMEADISDKDISEALQLVLQHRPQSILRALHHYVLHFCESFWCERGRPLRGLPSSWSEVGRHRKMMIEDSEHERILLKCGCHSRN
jgi:hypothetical protein